jgi:hypothetical protein
MRVHRTAAVAALLLLTGGLVTAQEMLPNQEFTDWSKFKKGTSVTLKTTSDAGGMKSEVVLTTTVVETGADKLVLETTSTTKVNGMEFKAPAVKRDVPKTVPLPPGIKKEDFTATKPPGTYEEGAETVKIAGAVYKSKWYKSKFEMDKTKVESKMWLSEDVPGRLVKGETTVTGPVNVTTKMEVTEIKKP